MKKYKCMIKGTTPILMHKFNGLAEEKRIREFSDSEQAEKHAYRHQNGNLAIPSEWVRGCIINNFIDKAGSKQKTSTKKKVAPRIRVEPRRIDLGLKDYEVDVRSVPSGGLRGGVRDMCVRPLIEEWGAEFILLSQLDYSQADIKRNVEIAGIDVGIGSNRINGYGRFMLESFEEITS